MFGMDSPAAGKCAFSRIFERGWLVQGRTAVYLLLIDRMPGDNAAHKMAAFVEFKIGYEKPPVGKYPRG
jgi:hypothetical protein